jgi:hypothetical protein
MVLRWLEEAGDGVGAKVGAGCTVDGGFWALSKGQVRGAKMAGLGWARVRVGGTAEARFGGGLLRMVKGRFVAPNLKGLKCLSYEEYGVIRGSELLEGTSISKEECCCFFGYI